MVIIFLVIGGIVGYKAYEYFAPSKERVDIQEIYKVPKGEVKLFINDSEWEKNGLIIDNAVYVDYGTIQDFLTENIYYDSNEKLLIVTTATKNVIASPDSKKYTINGEEKDYGRVIYTVYGEELYIEMDFVCTYGKVEYVYNSEPDRAVIYSDFEKEFLSGEVSVQTPVRVEGDKKSEIMYDLQKGEKVHVKAEGTKLTNGYVKVLSENGVTGYAKEEDLGELKYEKVTTDYVQEEYKSLNKGEKINMTWHAVYVEASANSVNELIDRSPGVNVISPTWFRLSDEEGNFTSLANQGYVDAAHEKGVEVWALVSDVEVRIDAYKLFSYTSKRKKLIKGLIDTVKEYNIDGINVDFEVIGSKSAPHYIQFLRELSVECRKEGIVMSVDTYVPMPFNEFFRRDIQGKVADYVVIMAYDEHYSGSEESGSVSSISWVTNAVKGTISQVDPQKVIIGIPFYTRLWEEKRNSDGSIEIVSVKSLSMTTANETLEKNSAAIVFNEETGQDYAQYEKNGNVYRMWLENAKSIKLKLEAIKEGNCIGVASWRAGYETPDIWQVIEEGFMS